MRDMYINLPSWAVREGYTLGGDSGTYGELYLSKHTKVVKYWTCLEKCPNIFEMEVLIRTLEASSWKY